MRDLSLPLLKPESLFRHKLSTKGTRGLAAAHSSEKLESGEIVGIVYISDQGQYRYVQDSYERVGSWQKSPNRTMWLTGSFVRTSHAQG